MGLGEEFVAFSLAEYPATLRSGGPRGGSTSWHVQGKDTLVTGK